MEHDALSVTPSVYARGGFLYENPVLTSPCHSRSSDMFCDPVNVEVIAYLPCSFIFNYRQESSLHAVWKPCIRYLYAVKEMLCSAPWVDALTGALSAML